MTYVPNLDLEASHIASSTDIGSSLDSNAPIVLLDTATRRRVPYFAELDAQTTNMGEQLLLIHPAVALTEAHRYAVVLRDLVDTSGKPIAPLPSTTAAWNATSKSSARMQYISKVLHTDLASVIGSTEPYMAWDFTVASEKSLAGPALTMRRLAYQWLATHHLPHNGTVGSRERRCTGLHRHLVDDDERGPRRPRHVPGAAVPHGHHAVLCHDRRPAPVIRSSTARRPGRQTSSACCRRPSRPRARHYPPCTATACWEARARSRGARSPPPSPTTWRAAPPTGSA